MPTKQRLRRNHEHRPPLPRQNAACGSEQQPIPLPQRRPLHPPTQHSQLVPQHRVLELQRSDHRTTSKETKQPSHREVDEEEQHEPIVRSDRLSASANPEFPRPSCCTSTKPPRKSVDDT